MDTITAYLSELQYIIPMLLFIVTAIVFSVMWDKQKARYIKFQTIFDNFAKKALADRNEFARVPAEVLTRLFELDVRTIKPFDARPGKQHRHPALRRMK